MSKTTKKSKRRQSTGRAAKPRPVKSASSGSADRFEKVFEKIYRLVLRIPRGRVMTYGQIAQLLEDRYSPRLVGWAMHATPRDARNIPWHRVINSRGSISTGRVILTQPDVQQLLLEAEGVAFDDRGHCDLSLYQWSPRRRAARAKLRKINSKVARSRSRAKSLKSLKPTTRER